MAPKLPKTFFLFISGVDIFMGRIFQNSLEWPGPAPLGSALPHKELPKVGVWCRRDNIFSKKLAFGVDETTLDF